MYGQQVIDGFPCDNQGGGGVAHARQRVHEQLRDGGLWTVYRFGPHLTTRGRKGSTDASLMRARDARSSGSDLATIKLYDFVGAVNGRLVGKLKQVSHTLNARLSFRQADTKFKLPRELHQVSAKTVLC